MPSLSCNGSLLFSSWGQSRAARKSFSSPEGDHITLVNVYRASVECLEKINMTKGKKTTEKRLNKWCRENFINNRSLKHAHDIHRWSNLIFVWKLPMLILLCLCHLHSLLNSWLMEKIQWVTSICTVFYWFFFCFSYITLTKISDIR